MTTAAWYSQAESGLPAEILRPSVSPVSLTAGVPCPFPSASFKLLGGVRAAWHSIRRQRSVCGCRSEVSLWSQGAQPSATSGGQRAVPAIDPVDGEVLCFPQTGFCVRDAAFADHFERRGGVRSLGYPVSRAFELEGFTVQLFQRGMLQKVPGGGVARMNLLDEGLLPYSPINGSTFPGPDVALIGSAPILGGPEYAERALAFVRSNVPDEWEGVRVVFLSTFLSTVSYEDAFPEGGGDLVLVPLLSLEVWGLPTSRPLRDPSNGNFVYQRFQRGILHYDATSGTTQGILIGDYLKSLITGQNLPADLEEQARGSRLYRQYNNDSAAGPIRPEDLPETNLLAAFERETAWAGASPPGGSPPAAGLAPPSSSSTIGAANTNRTSL